MIATFELTSPSVRDIMCGGLLCDGKQAQSLLISCDKKKLIEKTITGLTFIRGPYISFPLNT